MIQDQCGTNLALRLLGTACMGASLAILGNCYRSDLLLLTKLCSGTWICRGGKLIGGRWPIPSTVVSDVMSKEACQNCHTSRAPQEPEQWQSHEVLLRCMSSHLPSVGTVFFDVF